MQPLEVWPSFWHLSHWARAGRTGGTESWRAWPKSHTRRFLRSLARVSPAGSTKEKETGQNSSSGSRSCLQVKCGGSTISRPLKAGFWKSSNRSSSGVCVAPPGMNWSFVGTMEIRRVERGRTLEWVKASGVAGGSAPTVLFVARCPPSAMAWRSRMVSTEGPVGELGRGANVHTMLPLALNTADSNVTRSAVGREAMK